MMHLLYNMWEIESDGGYWTHTQRQILNFDSLFCPLDFADIPITSLLLVVA
jgi:hypothetical protein